MRVFLSDHTVRRLGRSMLPPAEHRNVPRPETRTAHLVVFLPKLKEHAHGRLSCARLGHDAMHPERIAHLCVVFTQPELIGSAIGLAISRISGAQCTRLFCPVAVRARLPLTLL